jgi:uncharacterized SAM-binding protein YcdF (DUF218 family)
VLKRSFVAISIFIGLLSFSALMDFSQQIRMSIGDFLLIQDDLTRVDVIHVIAGDDYRTEYAIQLYKQGYASRLFFTGGWCVYHDYYHGQHALQLALAAGISRDAILYDDSPVLSTYDEALLLKKFLEVNRTSYKSVMVVSDPYHMRRTRWTYRHIFGNGYEIRMAPVPFEQTPFKQQWWTDAPSESYVRDEYKKLIYYFFRYQLNIRWLAAFDKY